MAIARDPACGMDVDTETSQHEGQTYWFCSRGSMLDFHGDPAGYLAADDEPHI